MRRIRMVGCALVLVGALCGVAAAGASAELPEVGRCVKLTPTEVNKHKHYSGAYAGPNCTSLNASHHGKYEWMPGPGPQNKFKGTANEPEPVLETPEHIKVTCSDGNFFGEYVGTKSMKLSKVVFTGCQTGPNKPCQTTAVAHEGEIESAAELEGTLGVIKAAATPKVGWDMKRSGGGTVFTFLCGKLPELQSMHTIEGSVIGQVLSGTESNIDKMNLQSEVRYTQKNGVQSPEKFETGAKDTFTDSMLTGTSKSVEPIALGALDVLVSGLGKPVEEEKNQEPLEIKVK